MSALIFGDTRAGKRNEILNEYSIRSRGSRQKRLIERGELASLFRPNLTNGPYMSTDKVVLIYGTLLIIVGGYMRD